MRSLTTSFLLLAAFLAAGALAPAQSTKPASPTNGSSSVSATKEEVNELRSEVAAQRRTIEELKALVEKLAQDKTRAVDGSAQVPGITPVADTLANDTLGVNDTAINVKTVSGPSASSSRLINTVLVQPVPAPEAVVVDQPQPAAAPKKDTPLTAGWNGEHFFIKSPDGQFSISPYGYVNTDYRAYSGDGAPANTFLLRQARFGFQGNYGSHFDFAILADAAATTGSVVRDVYLNVRYNPMLQFQAGQFKTPFAPGNRNRRYQPGFCRTRISIPAVSIRCHRLTAVPAPLCTATLTAAWCSTG